MSMDAGKQKEQFNIAYVNAIAAQVGVNPSKPEVDDDSIDIQLTGKGFQGKIRNPQIQLQLKCSSQELLSGDVVKFRLSRKNYNDLRGDDLVCPRYLVVLLVPKNEHDWIGHLYDGIHLRHLCYWVSIRDLPETQSESVTIDIPITQRLTATQLQLMMDMASDGKSA